MVNNDGELAVDVIDEAAMATLLNKEMAARGIDGRTARAKEERWDGNAALAGLEKGGFP